jgi:hypothetical protein
VSDDKQTPEDIVAEELGVQPEEMDLPSPIRRGIHIFELEDGSFGWGPSNDKTGLLDATGLLARAKSIIAAESLKEALKAEAKAQRARPKLTIPGRSRG